MHRTMLALAAALLAAGSAPTASAADATPKPPASGKARFQVSYVQYADHFVQLDEKNSFGAMEFAGTTRSLDGQPWFDRMSERCTGSYYKVDGESRDGNGSCLYTDAAGDKLMILWRSTGRDVGSKEIVGGTGKFAGITGTGAWTSADLPQPAENVWAWVVDVELDFKVKPPTQ